MESKKRKGTMKGANPKTKVDYNRKPSQAQIILSHLQKNGTISTYEAFMKYGITRLSGRIYELKKSGHVITATLKKSKEHNTYYAEYKLEDENV